MTWFYFGIVTVLLTSIITISQKSYVNKRLNHSVIVGTLYQIVAGLFIALYAAFAGLLTFEFTPQSALLAAVAMALFALGTWTYFTALHRIAASSLTILLTTRSVVTLIVASLFLHESISAVHISGMICLVLAIGISQKISFVRLNKKSVAIALLTASLFGVANVLERVLLTEMNWYLYLALAFMLPGITLFFIQKSQLPKHLPIQLNAGTVVHILLIGIATAIAGITSVHSIAWAPSTAAYSFLSQSRVVVTVILAYLLLRERSHPMRTIFASFLCLIGLYLLAL